MYKGGKSYYRYAIEQALKEIDSLPGRFIYFLDDNLFADEAFAIELMDALKGMGRIFQAASTLKALANPVLLRKAADAGLKSVFTGFETLSAGNLAQTGKRHNQLNYKEVIRSVHDQGLLINGSFVFGLDDDGPEVFERTTEWAIANGITTATFHIATPFPGTAYHEQMIAEGRLLHRNWDLYDTRHAVYKPARMSPSELEQGYQRAYHDFYSWNGILQSAMQHDGLLAQFKHLLYATVWKKMELPWRMLISAGLLPMARYALDKGLAIKSRNETKEEIIWKPERVIIEP